MSSWSSGSGRILDFEMDAEQVVVVVLEEGFEVEELRKRQTTAQSSTLEVGYLIFQALTADSTNALAADDCAGTELTISTTSLLDKTSHICQNNQLLCLKLRMKYASPLIFTKLLMDLKFYNDLLTELKS